MIIIKKKKPQLITNTPPAPDPKVIDIRTKTSTAITPTPQLVTNEHPLILERPAELLKVMKKTKPISDLLLEANANQSRCWDIDGVKANDFYLTDDLKLGNRVDDTDRYALSQYAFGQLLNKSGMDNVKYAKKCIEKG